MVKIRIVTFGCSNNVAEGEMMAGLLSQEGYDIVGSEEDILIVNLCAVKGPSLNKGIKLAKKAKSKVIFAGCIPKTEIKRIISAKPSASLVSTHNITKIVETVSSMLYGNRVEFLEEKRSMKLCMPRIRQNKIISIIPICTGCVGSCSYCAVKAIKGSLLSYPVEKIMKEAKESIREGCKELWITAQDTGCYGEDINTSLPVLLKNILSLEGDFKVRLGMANPQHIRKYINEMIELYRHPKMFKFLHIPIQSGNDRILKLMNRKYTPKDFIEAVSRFRKEVENITISTDIIVGFPTETEAEFMDSVKVIREVKPDVLNLNRFWKMPGTASERLKQLPSEILKERSKRMLEEFNRIALERNKKWVGWEGSVIIDEEGKEKTFVARNYAYKPIILKGKLSLGKEINVKIEKVTAHDLRASSL